MSKQHISTVKELMRLIPGGKHKEGQRLEFKSAFRSEQVGKAICGLANAEGGTLLVGVDDDGNIVEGRGYASNKNEDKAQNIAQDMDPAVDVSTEGAAGDVLCVTVPEHLSKPCSYKGQYFIRKGTTTRQLTKDELRDLFHEEGVLQFDAWPCKQFSLKDDLGDDNWKSFRKRAKLPAAKGRARTDVLRSRNLIDAQGNMTNAGALLLARDSHKFNASWEAKCILFAGNGASILDTKEFHADIATNIEEVHNWLLAKININIVVNGKPRHERVPEVPEEVLREVVVNALVHRDYYQGGHVQVNVFGDRIEVHNPGGLPKGMTAKMLGKRKISVPRNNLLFQTLQGMNFGERAGRGINTIRDLCRKHGLREPEFEPEEESFTVTLFRRAVGGAAAPRSAAPAGKADATEQAMLRLLGEHEVLSAARLAEHLGIDPASRSFRRRLRNLLEQGRIKYAVPGKPRSSSQAYRLTASEMRERQDPPQG